MTDRAKLFKSGGSQAVRLPKRYRFDDQDEVVISRHGNRVVLQPRRKNLVGGIPVVGGRRRRLSVPTRTGARRARARLRSMRYLLDGNVCIDYLTGR